MPAIPREKKIGSKSFPAILTEPPGGNPAGGLRFRQASIPVGIRAAWKRKFRTGQSITAVFSVPSPDPLPQGERENVTVIDWPVLSISKQIPKNCFGFLEPRTQ